MLLPMAATEAATGLRGPFEGEQYGDYGRLCNEQPVAGPESHDGNRFDKSDRQITRVARNPLATNRNPNPIATRVTTLP
ncbi:MAG: hypothetical protein ACJAQZ_003230 [Planctomycetota bacterium]|jgi:hypothetical protein